MNSEKFTPFIAALKTNLKNVKNAEEFVKKFRDIAANLVIDIDALTKFIDVIIDEPTKYGDEHFVGHISSSLVVRNIKKGYAVWTNKISAAPAKPIIPKYFTQYPSVHKEPVTPTKIVYNTPMNYVIINPSDPDDEFAREIQVNLGVGDVLNEKKILDIINEPGKKMQVPLNTYGLYVPDEPLKVMPPRSDSYIKQYQYRKPVTKKEDEAKFVRNGFNYANRGGYPIYAYPFAANDEKCFRLTVIVGYHTSRYGKNSPTGQLCNHLENIEKISTINPEPKNVLPGVDKNVISDFFAKNIATHRSYLGIVFVNTLEDPDSKDLYLRIKSSNSNDYYDLCSNTITFGQEMIDNKYITYSMELVKAVGNNTEKVPNEKIKGANEQYVVCKKDEDESRMNSSDKRLLMLVVYSVHTTSLGKKQFVEYRI